MKRPFLWILMAAVLLLSACGGAPSANRLDAIREAGVIKVGITADYPPFEYVDKSGNKMGLDIDLMTEIARHLGVQVEWVDLPFDSLIASVQQKKVDVGISSLNKTAEHAKQVTFSDPYYILEDSFLAANLFRGTLKTPEDCVRYKVGTHAGSTQDTWLTDLVKSGKLKEGDLIRYDRIHQAIPDLKSGRIDILMADSDPAALLARQVGGIKVILKAMVTSGPLVIALPLNDSQMAQAINDILKILKSNGFIDRLVQKYLVYSSTGMLRSQTSSGLLSPAQIPFSLVPSGPLPR